jgi:regulator of sigma E protease
MDTLKNIFLILIVILSFNFMIFIHELGHYLAARWRGLKIEKFQVWFGKPIWSKTINGVQYGLGWIPAGGFVSLPQLAPMDAIEGERTTDEPLPPISPIDKIIVAVAGPIFSLGLALAVGLLVWNLGKPVDIIPSTTIGYIAEESPASKAGFQIGDRITAVNGEPVQGFVGGLDFITEKIIFSEGETIKFTVIREGETTPREISSSFITEPTKFYQRRGLRKVGISYASQTIVAETSENSPARIAGLQKGDIITAIDGVKLWSPQQITSHYKQINYRAAQLTIQRGTETLNVTLAPEVPQKSPEPVPMLGIAWDMEHAADTHLVHPSPVKQCSDSVKMMIKTIGALISPASNIGIDQLSGPISIAKAKFDLLDTDKDGWRRLLAFLVLINVNLAIFNMLPFPVLDGGHTTLAIMELIARRPVKVRVLEYVQSFCVLLIFSLFLFITFKDVGSFFGNSPDTEVIFSPK